MRIPGRFTVPRQLRHGYLLRKPARVFPRGWHKGLKTETGNWCTSASGKKPHRGECFACPGARAAGGEVRAKLLPSAAAGARQPHSRREQGRQRGTLSWGRVSLAALPWRGGAGPGWSHGELSLHGRGRAALPPRFMGCGAAVPPEPRAAHRLPPPPPGRFPRFRKGRNYGNPIRGPWKHDAGSREPQRGRLALPCPVPAPPPARPPARGVGAPAGTGVREGNTRAFRRLRCGSSAKHTCCVCCWRARVTAFGDGEGFTQLGSACEPCSSPGFTRGPLKSL